MAMWTKETERDFFHWALELQRCKPQELFYKSGGRYYFYLPVGVKGEGEVKQARNPLVGRFTEQWAENFLKIIVKDLGLVVVRNKDIPAFGLTGNRAPDLAICYKEVEDVILPENLVAIVEVKMSIVWNWEWDPLSRSVNCIGDFRTHKGRPSVLRSDNVLKALGKAVEVRGNGYEGLFIVLCNSPISNESLNQIDGWKQTGIVQGFFSVNPRPLNGQANEKDNPKGTPKGGFLRWDSPEEAKETLQGLVANKGLYFSGFLSMETLGRLIEYASRGKNFVEKARLFISELKRHKGE